MNSFSQNYKIGDTIYYHSKKISLKKTKRFIIIKEIKEDLFLVDYYLNKSDSIFKHLTAKLKSLDNFSYYGQTIKYFKTGEIQSKGFSENNSQIGLWKFYLKNGNLTHTKFYSKKGENWYGSKIIDAWDIKGNQTVKNSNGIQYLYHENDSKIVEYGTLKNGEKDGVWKGKNKERLFYEEKYKTGKLIKGISWNENGTKYKYKKVFQRAQYKGGQKSLIKFIQKNFKTPKIAIEKNIKGRIYGMFKIDKKGNVFAPEVANSLHPEITKEIYRVLSKMEKWSPGRKRGQLANTSFTIPFVL